MKLNVRDRWENSCLYCGQAGHHIQHCSLRPPIHPTTSGNQVSHSQLVSLYCSFKCNAFALPIILQFSGLIFALTAIISSGAAGNFINQETVTQLNIPMEPLPKPRKIQVIDGGPIVFITHRTLPLLLQAESSSRIYISLFITKSPKSPLILGLPWMEIHNPRLSWSAKQLNLLLLSSLSFTSRANHHCATRYYHHWESQ